MSTTTQQLKVRVARIEKELAELKAALPKSDAKPWYRQIVGDFSDDPVYAEIIRLGQQLRRGPQ